MGHDVSDAAIIASEKLIVCRCHLLFMAATIVARGQSSHHAEDVAALHEVRVNWRLHCG